MIERIIIENFKSIRKLDLELKPINILIGANGAGKSNFISFLQLSNRIYEQKLQEYLGNEFAKFLYYGRKKSDYIYGLIDFENEYAFYYTLKHNYKGNSGHISYLRFCHNIHKDIKDYIKWEQVFEQGGAFLECEMLHPRYENSMHVEVADKYLKTFKVYHFHDTGRDSPLKRMNGLNDNRYLRENGENLASYLYYLQEKYPKDFRNIA
ncbi:MAG TPA: AAA family ATPase, partial [Pyrinomonadaceae bacterium]